MLAATELEPSGAAATGAIPRTTLRRGLSSPPSIAELSSVFSRSNLSFTRSSAAPAAESPPLKALSPPSPDFTNCHESSQPPSSSASLKSSPKSSESSLPSFPSSVSLPGISSVSSTPSLSPLPSTFSLLTDFSLPRTDTASTSCRSLLPGHSSKSLPEGSLEASSQIGTRARSELTSVSDKRPKSAPMCLLHNAQSTSSPPGVLSTSSSQRDSNVQTSTQDPSTLPLAEQEWSPWPFTSQLALGIHNGTADGFTALKICGFFLQLLNDVIAGTPINDEQLAEFVAGETSTLIAEKKAAIEGNPLLKLSLTKEYVRKQKKSELELLFEVSEGPEDQALHLTSVLDQPTTKLLREKCCTEGVTLHSAFCALATVAFVDLLVAKDIICEKYVSSKHIINMRHYWRGDSSLAFGCHIAHLNLRTKIQRETMEDFWSFARSFHEKLQEEMDGTNILQEAALNEICRSNVQDSRDIFLKPSTRQTDYYASNMGDVTSLLQGGPHVRLEFILSTVSVSKFNISCAHLFHTYRSRFVHTLDYSTKYMTRDLAGKYCNKIFELLQKVL
ncbi:uncharacterized protein [Cherax quadricarinatus]|uniref:uncharacterized protein n=1 Tax=Cherax quadricarinatus TaxID=27406 RepID=UPI00387EE223